MRNSRATEAAENDPRATGPVWTQQGREPLLTLPLRGQALRASTWFQEIPLQRPGVADPRRAGTETTRKMSTTDGPRPCA